MKDYNTPATVFWQVNGADVRGQLTDATLGNGLRTVKGLDQVTGWVDYTTLNGSTNLGLSYYANGNVYFKSDVGTYTYHAAKLHAVASINTGSSTDVQVLSQMADSCSGPCSQTLASRRFWP